MFYVCWMDLNSLYFNGFLVSCLKRNEKWGLYSEKKQYCGVPRSLYKNTWWCNSCAGSAAFPECLDRAQSGGEALRWYEEGGRVAGRMFRRIWPSFLPFFPLFIFHSSMPLISPALPPFFLPPSQPFPQILLSFSNPHLLPTLSFSLM